MSGHRFRYPSVLARLHPDRHGVIEASAGTGKTFTLEHLVVDLVLRGVPIEQILVVTFTDKATREMRTRIRETLRAVRHPEPSDSRLLAPDEPEQHAWVIDEVAARRLDEALLAFERAPISTIHGFCQRVLSDRAFESGRLFEQKLVEPRRAFSAAFRDLVRQELAAGADPVVRAILLGVIEERGIDGLEAALYSWSTERGLVRPDWDLRRFESTLSSLAAFPWDEVEHALRSGISRSDVAQEAVGAARELHAVAAGFAAKGDAVEALLAIDRWGRRAGPGEVELRRWLPARLQRGDPVALGDLSATVEGLLGLAPPPFGLLVHELLPRLRRMLDRRKGEEGSVDFDDMLRLVAEAIAGPDGPALVRGLRATYRIALVDEFQDTDEVQWSIFRELFVRSEAGHRLVVIGDPKQAIYGFRNADVHTYHRACEELVERGGSEVRLEENFRSSARVIEAYNLVFREDFFRGPITYDVPVRCGNRARRGYTGEGEAAGLVLWHAFSRDDVGVAELRSALGARIASESKRIVEEGELRYSAGGEAPVRLRYSDLHVLTRTRREAELLASELRAADVPFSLFKQEGLFASREASDLLAVLRAVADPHDRSARLRAFATLFFGVPLELLGECRELDGRHPLVARLFEWHARAESHDDAGLLRAIQRESQLERRLVGSPEGERSLTNVEHLADLLVEETGGRRGVDAMIALLEAFVAGRAEPRSGEGDVQRRESERDAIQILTMHKAKGLEAAVVFLAGGFSASRRVSPLAPTVAHRESPAGEMQREAWLPPVPDEVAELAERETREEDERLLYVALTRAKIRLYVPYFGSPPVQHASGFGPAFGPVRGPYRWLERRLEALVREGWVDDAGDGGRVRWEPLELHAPAPGSDALAPSEPARLDTIVGALRPVDPAAEREAAARAARGWQRRGWVMTSYTRLKERGVGPFDAEEGAPRAELDEAERLRGEAPTLEPGTSWEEADPVSRELPGGAGMGVFLHGVLEHADFESLAHSATAKAWRARPEVEALFAAQARAAGVAPESIPGAAELLHRALRAPQRFGDEVLPGGFSELRELEPELELFFPWPEAAHPSLSEPTPPIGIDARPYRLERGLVQGIVDLLFVRGGRVYFLDWKSDRVRRADDASLVAHVREHYAIQARLYTLGIVRLLGVRDAASYEARFGGLLYAFLRVMGAPRVDAVGAWSGTTFERPRWEDVVAWEAELREAAPE